MPGTSFEAQLDAVTAAVSEPDPAGEDAAWARLDSLTKPPRSLGRLEEVAARIACVQGTVRPDVEDRAIILMAADHGVVAEGVSPYPQEVTRQMVANFSAGGAAINQLAGSVEAELWLVDVGVAGDVSHLNNVRDEKIAAGTANMAVGPAMSREQAAQAAMVGVRMSREAAEGGMRLLGTGEMGIGNTTAAAALTCAYTGADPERVVGPGTGLDAAGVAHKVAVVKAALHANKADTLDALGKLAAVGGLEIAGLAGVVIGAAEQGVCVVADGFISGVAALAALRLCPDCSAYVFPSHLSAEPGHRFVLDALELEPIIALDMRLGEGTGAALAMSIMDAACRMLAGMATFEEAGVSEEGGG